MNLKNIRDCYGTIHKVNIDALSCVDDMGGNMGGNMQMCFGGTFISVSYEECDKILRELEHKDAHLKAQESGMTERIEQLLYAPNQLTAGVLNKVDVRAAILMADFLDAETKLKMMCLLGV